MSIRKTMFIVFKFYVCDLLIRKEIVIILDKIINLIVYVYLCLKLFLYMCLDMFVLKYFYEIVDCFFRDICLRYMKCLLYCFLFL